MASLPTPQTDAIAALTAAFIQQLTAVIQAGIPSPTAAPRLLTAKQAAEYIGRSEKAVRHLVAKSEIPAVRNDRCVRIDRADLDVWIERSKS